jgi:hypothetical protein
LLAAAAAAAAVAAKADTYSSWHHMASYGPTHIFHTVNVEQSKGSRRRCLSVLQRDVPFFMHWDGIHQIVSRFLEQFRYMCPLLFSCVFPSYKEFRKVGESLLS